MAIFRLLILLTVAFSQSIIQISTEKLTLLASDRITGHRKILKDLYCESWRFTVETNDAGIWDRVPARCEGFVKDYMTGDKYLSDLAAVADNSLAYAKTVKLSGDGKHAWIFDVDETLLSNIPFYASHGFGSEIFDEASFNKWVDMAEAPSVPASLRLYKDLEELGFTIILLTGRTELQRNATECNLQFAGYSNWERLILRKRSDHGKPATIYKSERRKHLEDEGYIIHGNSGDQWSDLLGFAVAKRSFKLPNLMYVVA
ncbi:acid phosphatase 1-like [Olea europaea var. sylvestris]|uniref:acid phosphatase 1-like n=1 Tax=Olea europaea var. sylvestris TaxID=158386 RepID=UPI000C1D5D94|nr:acid phosphatase 1-like [Olea europaea var. sylvestris]